MSFTNHFQSGVNNQYDFSEIQSYPANNQCIPGSSAQYDIDKSQTLYHPNQSLLVNNNNYGYQPISMVNNLESNGVADYGLNGSQAVLLNDGFQHEIYQNQTCSLHNDCIPYSNAQYGIQPLSLSNQSSSSSRNLQDLSGNGIHSVNNQLLLSSSSLYDINDNQTLSQSNQFKSYISGISTEQDLDDALCLPLNYQYMFDKRTSPWEMNEWDQDELNAFIIQAEKIDRLYHVVSNDEDPNFRSWELCCRMNYKGGKYFVEMYANCDYTGFGHISITKLPDFFLDNMVTIDQNPDKIYEALIEDNYNVQRPDPLHKMHPKFWNNTPMLKYLCHDTIYKNRDSLSKFKEQLPKLLSDSVDDFIKVKDWENE